MRQFKITERKTDRTGITEKYLSDISSIPVLTSDQEYELAVKSKNGDLEAREKLIKSNLRFVVSVAKAYASPKIPLMDLISQGNIGLIEAAEKFDPSLGFKFISYAVWEIRKNIFHYIGTKSRTVKVPQSVLNAISRIKKINIEYNQKYERDATIIEIQERFSSEDKGSFSKNIDLALAGIAADSFNIPLELRNGEDESETKSPILWLESEDTGFLNFENRDRSAVVNKLLDKLDPIEKKVVMMRMGYDFGIPNSFDSIGNKFDETKYWAETTFKKSIKKLKIEARKSKYDLQP